MNLLANMSSGNHLGNFFNLIEYNEKDKSNLSDNAGVAKPSIIVSYFF